MKFCKEMLLLRHAIGWNFRQNRISDVRINEACSRIESWSFSFPKRPTRRELTPNVDLEKGQGHCHRRSSDTVAYLPMSRSTAPTSYNIDELQHRRITTPTNYNIDELQHGRLWESICDSLQCGFDACNCVFWFGSDLF